MGIFGRRSGVAAVLVAIIATAGSGAASAAAHVRTRAHVVRAIRAHAAQTSPVGDAGAVKFVKRTESSFDTFTSNPTPEFVAWMNRNFWRTEVFSPYFDNKTKWYSHGWAYHDLYAMYKGSSYTEAHPNWILRDAAGNPLYIPYGCSGGSCPQYAADIGNPEFRRSWIEEAKAEVQKGYAGLWIDDVNLEFRVGNGNEQFVDPVDPRTGQAMTEQAWREYMDTFLEEIRSALPGVELVHNSIWFAGGTERANNPFVKREIASADYINLERGVNDSGLTGGSGQWSLQALFAFIDQVHAAGKGVVLDGADSSATGREYSLASYLEISSGNDGVGLGSMTPENWWPAFNLDLGEALGPRATWQGLLRRNFANGIALVNEPQARTRTVTLAVPMLTTENTVVTSVTIPAAHGAVLRYVTPPPAGSPPEGSVTPEGQSGLTPPSSQPNAQISQDDRSSTQPTGAAAAQPAGDEAVVVSVWMQSRKGGATVLVGGRVHSLRARELRPGRVRIRLMHARAGRWVAGREVSVSVRSSGRFSAVLRSLNPGRYRVHAAYLPLRSARVASSTTSAFRVPA